MDPARNLLFGMMAQRTNLIDADRLSDAYRRWTTQKDAALADLLVERRWLTAEDRSHVDYLVDRNVARYGTAREAFRATADGTTGRLLIGLNGSELRRWLDEALPGLARHDADAEPSKRGLGAGLAAVVLLVVLGLVGLVGLVGTALFFSRQRVQMEMLQAEAMRASVDAQMQRDLAQANLQKAREAVDQLLAKSPEIAELEGQQGNPVRQKLLEDAARFYQESLKEKDVNDPAVQKQLAQAYVKLSEIKIQLGEYTEAAQSAEQLSRLPSADGQTAYNAARLLARCAALTENDRTLPQDRRSSRVADYTDKAMGLLAVAKTTGYFDTPAHRELLEKNKDFDRFRDRDPFRKLLEKSPAAKD